MKILLPGKFQNILKPNNRVYRYKINYIINVQHYVLYWTITQKLIVDFTTMDLDSGS